MKRQAARRSSLLLDLPHELQLRVFEAVDDGYHHDLVALCLALPRLGIEFIRASPTINNSRLFAIAMKMCLTWSRPRAARERVLTDDRLRWYAQHSEAALEDFPFQNQWFADAALREASLFRSPVSKPLRLMIARFHDPESMRGRVFWHIGRGDEPLDEEINSIHTRAIMATLVRYDKNDGLSFHYEGDLGSERLCCICSERAMLEDQDGSQRIAKYYDGDRGSEALFRTERRDGTVVHYEGDRDAERIVRDEYPDGLIQYYEGEKGAERIVRAEFPDDGDDSEYYEDRYYEGDKDAERHVRTKMRSGEIKHFEGERGSERLVRIEKPDGKVHHFDGWRGSESLVRAVLLDGTEFHYSSKFDSAEMSVEYPDGSVGYFGGARGCETMVRMELPFTDAPADRDSSGGSTSGTVFHFIEDGDDPDPDRSFVQL